MPIDRWRRIELERRLRRLERRRHMLFRRLACSKHRPQRSKISGQLRDDAREAARIREALEPRSPLRRLAAWFAGRAALA